MRSLLLSALAGLACLPAWSFSLSDRVYVGIAAGGVHASGDFNEQVLRARAEDFTLPTGIDFSVDRRTGGRAFAGMRLAPWIALEADWADMGSVLWHATRYGISFPPAGQLRAELTGQVHFRSASLSILGSLPLSEQFDAFARAGVAYTKTYYHSEGTSFLPQADGTQTSFRTPVPDDSTARQTRPLLAIGAQYRAADRWSLRAEWARYFGVGYVWGEPRVSVNRGRFDLDLVTLGLVYRF
jgi:opacity protein-like surface antigen